MKLIGISGSPSSRSKTRIAVERAVRHAAERYPAVEGEVLGLVDYNLVFCDGRDPSLYEGDTRRVIDKVVEADAVIVGTPIYRATYTGILKNLFDLLPNDALLGKPVGLIATAGSDHHFLAIEHELKPLVGFFQAHALPGAVYAKNEHFDGGELVDRGVIRDLERLAEAVVGFLERQHGPLVGASAPSIERRSLDEGGREAK
ncbi:NAD(P)H-dependent FAD/FMN reductase [Rubrobacter xylanophilus DSM 9941]|uniref:NADPH-dependent FMN reductase n=1 Tax=Rubrobacter xylanophilus TaxID=49319 RepID=UPI001F291565|nr:NADPH-dependent FMN reductase [Rubrobacter xylanophilus]QYJ15057.1 NAD(P)H-dependent FAD/FMN reductase [Rubrobacter xylanophilus DSM 9941]